MNILMALSQLEVTGAEVYATELGNALSKRGHQLFYVSDTLSKKVEGRVFRLRFNRRSLPRRLWHIAYLVYLIRRYKIQLVHAHSRASGWSSYLACRLTNTPMVTNIHGRQPVHASRKVFHAIGYRALAVCEDVANQVIDKLEIAPDKVQVIRNGVDVDRFSVQMRPDNPKPVISVIGRLTGPKGDLCFKLLDEVLDLEKWDVRIITGSDVPARFEQFQGQVDFRLRVDDIPHEMAQSDLVIGAGRVAVESLLCGVPVFAIGEAKAIGLVSNENIEQAMGSNFGDIGEKELDFSFQSLGRDIGEALGQKGVSESLRARVVEEYNLENIATAMEASYQSAVVYTLRREMPIVMYHRFIEQESEAGVHGTWIWLSRFESHLKLLKRLGYETLTFDDLYAQGFIRRLEYGKKYVMITVDDGYQDNLTRMLPLLKKYNFKATVYVVTGESYNKWDADVSENPDIQVKLLTDDEIVQLDRSGHVDIGGHTLTHPRLDRLTPDEQKYEIEANKAHLEKILQKPLLSFAYPYGDFDASAKENAIQAGYQFAVATDSGPLAMHEDPFQIRRIAVFPRTDTFGLWRKIRGNYVFRRAH
jgi:peptidoglycan/xylan/chitin deacetylase (PgdA/CDA1 family)/glycosyltransferase involved in cell wall biosynthesis